MTGLLSANAAIVLASASVSRARLLTEAGIPFAKHPSGVNEGPIKESCRSAGATALEAATTLAEHKAVDVSHKHRDALVIGADQILELDGTWFDKPKDRTHARQHLLNLRGRTHALATAVAVAHQGSCIWQGHETPRLTMRPFSDVFLDRYLETCGDTILTSVGAYRLEGAGVHLFDRIEGDFFTILGLPLISLTAFLREHGALCQ